MSDQWVQRAAGVRQIDRELIDGVGIPSAVLMEHAGGGVAREIQAWAAREGLGAPETLVLCGPGNNGGDGYVVARHLAIAGWSVTCVPVLPAGTAECQLFYRVCQGLGLVPEDAQRRFIAALNLSRSGVSRPTLVIDAVLGSGQRAPTPAVDWAAFEGAHIVALDVATGVDADTGALLGEAPPRIDHVVTIGRPKPFLFCGPWLQRWTGSWQCVDIGFDQPAPRGRPDALLCGGDWAARPSVLVNKWARGHVAVLAGSAGMTGAASLCCRAALRAGAGMVTLFGLPPASLPPEVLTAQGPLDPARFQAIVVGPGLGRAQDHEVRRLWSESTIPMVLDADALRVTGLGPPGGLRLLTPHAGEAAAWLGADWRVLEADRFGTIARLRQDRVAAIYKGPCTLVTGDPPTVFEGRCPALGTAGSGDVLAGICGALLAAAGPQDLAELERVARQAVTLHLAAGRASAVGALASEIADAVPRARA